MCSPQYMVWVLLELCLYIQRLSRVCWTFDYFSFSCHFPMVWCILLSHLLTVTACFWQAHLLIRLHLSHLDADYIPPNITVFIMYQNVEVELLYFRDGRKYPDAIQNKRYRETLQGVITSACYCRYYLLSLGIDSFNIFHMYWLFNISHKFCPYLMIPQFSEILSVACGDL